MKISAKLVKELRENSGAGILDCKKALVAKNGNLKEAMIWLRENGIAKAMKKSSRIASEGIVEVSIKGKKAVIFEVNSETDFVAKNEKFLKLIKEIGQALVSSKNVKNPKDAGEIKIGNSSLKAKILEAVTTIGEKIELRRFEIIEALSGHSIGQYVHNAKNGVILLFKGNASAIDAKHLAMHVSAMNPKFISDKDVPESFIKSETIILTKKALTEGKPKKIVDKMVIGRLKKALSEICFLDQKFIINPEQTISSFLKEKKLEIVKMIRYEVGEGIEKETIDFAEEVMRQVKK